MKRSVLVLAAWAAVGLAGCREKTPAAASPAPAAPGSAPAAVDDGDLKPSSSIRSVVVHEESTDAESLELKAFATELMTAARDDEKKLKDLLTKAALPDPKTWYVRVFGAEAGGRQAALHEGRFGVYLEEVSFAFRKMAERGYTEVHVYRIDDGSDKRAMERQKLAFKWMQERVALFSVVYKDPERSEGRTVHSWVKVDGFWRLIGNLPGLPMRN